MEATGIIFAGLDCDADAIEEWNRWYDLEHVPPNVSMPGVMLGHRYVAPPALHATRVVDAESGFAAGRGTFLTIYTLCGDPASAFDDMTVLRDELYGNDRMRFPADKKAVREGDVLGLSWTVPDPARTLVRIDVPFVGHTALLVVQRRSEPGHGLEGWYRDEWAPTVVRVDGVHGVASFASHTRPGLAIDLVYLEAADADAAVAVTEAVRAAAPHHADARVVLDAPFLRIDPLRYPWADTIRASDLPPTVQ
jgi:hypothetical protein